MPVLRASPLLSTFLWGGPDLVDLVCWLRHLGPEVLPNDADHAHGDRSFRHVQFCVTLTSNTAQENEIRSVCTGDVVLS